MEVTSTTDGSLAAGSLPVTESPPLPLEGQKTLLTDTHPAEVVRVIESQPASPLPVVAILPAATVQPSSVVSSKPGERSSFPDQPVPADLPSSVPETRTREKPKGAPPVSKQKKKGAVKAAVKVAVAKEVCAAGDQPGNCAKAMGWFGKKMKRAGHSLKRIRGWAARNVFRYRNRVKQWIDYLARFNGGASRRSRRANHGAVMPISRTMVTIVAGVIVVAAATTGYFLYAGQESPETGSKSSARKKTRKNKGKLPDSDCPATMPDHMWQLCHDAVAADKKKLADTLASFTRAGWQQRHFPVMSVTNTVGRDLLSPPESGSDCTSLYYSDIGFDPDRDNGIPNSPGYKISEKKFANLAYRVAGLLIDTIPELMSDQESASQAMAQVLMWCGLPFGSFASTLHTRCASQIVDHIRNDGIEWYKQGVHSYYFAIQNTEATSPGSYLSFSVVYPLSQECSLDKEMYIPRLLEIEDSPRLSVNRPLHPDNRGNVELRIDWLPERFKLLSFFLDHWKLEGNFTQRPETLNLNRRSVYLAESIDEFQRTVLFAIVNDEPVHSLPPAEQLMPAPRPHIWHYQRVLPLNLIRRQENQGLLACLEPARNNYLSVFLPPAMLYLAMQLKYSESYTSLYWDTLKVGIGTIAFWVVANLAYQSREYPRMPYATPGPGQGYANAGSQETG